jgi:GDP-L-galactose phosphorylase
MQVCGLVFEAGGSIEDLGTVVGEACQRLAAANVPHNLFVVDCGQRVFLFPNAFARAKAQGIVPEDLLDTQVCAQGLIWQHPS